MKLHSLSDAGLIEQIIEYARGYRRRFGKNLGVTSEIGEYLSSELLNLKRADGNINPGYDARDSNRKRVQIKSRVHHKDSERTGYFSNFDFDYAILVLLSDDYEVTEIHKASRRVIEKQITTQQYKRPSLSIGEFKSIGVPIYPETE